MPSCRQIILPHSFRLGCVPYQMPCYDQRNVAQFPEVLLRATSVSLLVPFSLPKRSCPRKTLILQLGFHNEQISAERQAPSGQAEPAVHSQPTKCWWEINVIVSLENLRVVCYHSKSWLIQHLREVLRSSNTTKLSPYYSALYDT